jgi:hypothetical protein
MGSWEVQTCCWYSSLLLNIVVQLMLMFFLYGILSELADLCSKYIMSKLLVSDVCCAAEQHMCEQ